MAIENFRKTRNIVVEFIKEYKNKPEGESNVDWLNRQFASYPELWSSEEERRKDAGEIVNAIDKFEKDKKELDDHLKNGHSIEKYVASKLEQGAEITGVVSVGQYAQGIDKALSRANEAMLKRITTRTGIINNGPQLKGFIMETDHVNTFNIDAAAKESRAHAITNESYNKNSVDIVVRNTDGTHQRYQAKCGTDVDHSNQAFQHGDYRGQRKLVTKGQTGEVPNSTDHLESKDGVRSTARTNEEYVQRQKEIQSKRNPDEVDPGYEWKGVNKVAIAKSIGKKAAWAGVLAVGFQGARIIGRRFWNFLTGKQNQSVEKDLQEFATSAISSGASAGLTVAATGGLTVAVKNGWLGTALKNTPAGWIANAACIGIENIKVLWKLGKGEINGEQALDMAARTSTSLLGGLMLGAKGTAVGAAIGTVFGPIGSFVGGCVGGCIGGIAGSTIGEAVYEGAKKACSSLKNAVCSVAKGIGNFVKGALSIFS